MSPVNEAELVQLLADAQRAGSKPLVDLGAFDEFDLETGYRIALAQQRLLGEEVALYKTVLRNDGLPANASPIWKSRVGYSHLQYVFPTGFDIIGVELEVGVKLAKDIPAGEDWNESSIQDAIEYYFLGIEIVGTRLKHGGQASRLPTPAQSLADHNSALGYVIGSRCTRGANVIGLRASIELNGVEIDQKPAAPGSGSILASLLAYAKVQHESVPLRAGTIITPGSLSGMIPLPPGSKGHIVGKLGNEVPVGFYLQ